MRTLGAMASSPEYVMSASVTDPRVIGPGEDVGAVTCAEALVASRRPRFRETHRRARAPATSCLSRRAQTGTKPIKDMYAGLLSDRCSPTVTHACNNVLHYKTTVRGTNTLAHDMYDRSKVRLRLRMCRG